MDTTKLSPADMLAILSVLEEARDLIEKEKRWCKGATARSVAHRETLPHARDAVRWDATGAVFKVLGERAQSANPLQGMFMWCVALLSEAASMRIVDCNDRLGHAAVMAAYDIAIARVRRELYARRLG